MARETRVLREDKMPTNPTEGLKPLNIKCTSTACGDGLHCFLLTKKMKQNGPSGRCRSCGAQLVDWNRLFRRDLKDVTYTLESLKRELIRHHFWHIPISLYAENYARRKGKVRLKIAARKQIEHAVGKISHPREGQQTARESNPHANAVHYAQHATASCCRRCVEEWHGISRDRELTPDEITYLSELAMEYIAMRLPDLAVGPIYVPSLHGADGRTSTATSESGPAHAH
jgi:hypothetical protein